MSQNSPERGTYRKVLDGRKIPIRGLWVRNGRYYARLNVEDPATGKVSNRRVPLEDAKSVAEAREALNKLKLARADKKLPRLGRKPKFSDYADRYLDHHEKAKDSKRATTLETEKVHLRAWKVHLGDLRLDQVNRQRIRSFMAKRQDEGAHARTVNLALTVLNNVLHWAMDEEILAVSPVDGLKRLKVKTKKKELVELPQIEQVCEQGLEHSKNGVQLADFIRLCAYCGARESEVLQLKWEHVNWQRRQLTIGWEGDTKNANFRDVDFNEKLEAQLQEMHSRRAPDSVWIFPSPQRGWEDRRAKSFRESLRIARHHAKMPTFGFHDCRHYFISTCVMSGIDFMTIAKWVGHQDGGILIGKVYGHLADEHRKRMAEKIEF